MSGLETFSATPADATATSSASHSFLSEVTSWCKDHPKATRNMVVGALGVAALAWSAKPAARVLGKANWEAVAEELEVGGTAQGVSEAKSLNVWGEGVQLLRGDEVLASKAVPILSDQRDSFVAIMLRNKDRAGVLQPRFANGVLLTDNGLVATAGHVANAAEKDWLQIVAGGKIYPAEVVTVSADADAALLQIKHDSDTVFRGLSASATETQSESQIESQIGSQIESQIKAQVRAGSELVAFGWKPEGLAGSAARKANIAEGRFSLNSFSAAVTDEHITLPAPQLRLTPVDVAALPKKGEFVLADFPNINGAGFSGGPVFEVTSRKLVGLTSWGKPGMYLGITPIKDVLSMIPKTVE